VILSVLPLYTLLNGDYRNGLEESFLQAGITCLTAIVVVVNLKVFFHVLQFWFCLLILFSFFSCCLFITDGIGGI
jgi:hypothetical protein